jgi:sugar phosphate isomerase/epimerase
VGESARYVDDVAHPNVRLLVDSYHLMLDNDSLDDVVANGHLLHHVHVATLDNRLPPGLESCDFSDFFRALTLSGYDGPISIEARWDDIDAQASKAYESLVRMVEDQAAGAARS